MSNNCIFMALDEKYEKYAKPCIRSIHTNWSNYPKIFIFSNKISNDFASWTKDYNIILKKYDELSFKTNGPVGSNIIYTKYNCWNPKLFKDYDNVLHLDCDTIILKPLDGLFSNESIFIDNNETINSVKCFTNMDVPMCNAGIFVVNKKHITDDNFTNLIEITEELEKYAIYADQSIISLWCQIKNISLSNDVYYNFQPQFINYKDKKYDFNDIKILHFAARKPDTIAFHTWWRCLEWHKVFYDLWRKYT